MALLHHNHRHNPTAPLGLILLKLVLGVGVAIVKKKLADKIEAKLAQSARPVKAESPRNSSR